MLAAVLQPIQQRFPAAQYPDVLVGLDAPDDAAIYKINDTQAIVQTVDFFTPVVDDPYAYGAIAAANALSDVYAMGGEPLFALNIAALPEDLPPDIISAIFRGGAEKAAEAGTPIIGGHTIKDKEPKFGLTVTGLMQIKDVMVKGGARPGDALVLTKPLGTGVITTAHKDDKASAAHVDSAIASMARLNREAARAARKLRARGATDITGFGLLGHALEMSQQAGAMFAFFFSHLPFLPGALEYGEQWIFPGGASTNKAHVEAHVKFDRKLEEWQRMMIYDPETSGGLLVPVAAAFADEYVAEVVKLGGAAWIVGEVRQGQGLTVVK
jgi:selenide, water dikinase